MSIKVKAIQHTNVRLETPEQAEDFYGRILGLQRDPAMPWSEDRRLMWWNIPGGNCSRAAELALAPGESTHVPASPDRTPPASCVSTIPTHPIAP